MLKALGAALAAVALSGCATAQVEEPAYTLQIARGPFEVREYAPMIVAEVTVDGDAWGTRFAGFGPLADYIFAKGREGEKIAMTAPVTQAPRAAIDMTAPVTQTAASAGSWTIGFTMPASYSMATLPPPTNPNVKLVEQPSRTMAVYRFTGISTAEDMEDATRALARRIEESGLQPVGEPVFAFYDPPWVLPFFRRNEVMMQVAPRG